MALVRIGSPEEFVERFLADGVWHTTLPDRMKQLEISGMLLAEPDLPDAERHSTGAGPSLYPFVRQLGGVSLFDFRSFEPAAYALKYPMSNWDYFVPTQPKTTSSHWLGFDPSDLQPNFLSAHSLLEEWHQIEGPRPRLMPNIEAAHIGNLPLLNAKRHFKVTRDADFWMVELVS